MKKYIVFGSDSTSDYKFYFVNEGKELLDLLNELKDKSVHPNIKQSLITLYCVIEEDKKYPTTLNEMKKEIDERRVQTSGGFYVIHWKQKNGKYRTKLYDFIEDLELRVESLEEQGITDILILDEDESRNADSFLRWDIKEMIIEERL